jgi:nucleotide-binding universal stress UspA family protein
MKTYLIPVDFSAASVNAAEFAAALSHKTDVEHLVLLNTYYVTLTETLLPTPDMVQLKEEDIEQNITERLDKLELLKISLLEKVKPGVEISIHLNRTHLVRAVVENVRAYNADLVIIGSKGNSSHEDAKLGSHVINVAKTSPVPVVVVPKNYAFENVNRVVVACDFNKITETIPLEALKKVLNRKKFDLLIVNVDSKSLHNAADAQRIAEETALYTMLKAYSPQYFFVNHSDIIKGVLQFAAEQEAQLVIALPHKYSFLQSLIHNSVSQQLVESSAVPILILK